MLTNNTGKKACLACGNILKGRADKKFCNDYCRNNYNNLQKSKDNYSNIIRNINNALLKNRKVLQSLLPTQEDLAKTTREKLLRRVFILGTSLISIPQRPVNSIFIVTTMAIFRLTMTGFWWCEERG